MRILFITRGYPSESYKTHGIFEYDMAKALVNAGHEVTYIAVDMRSFRRKRRWGFESFQRDGIQIEGINIPLGRIYNPLKTAISEKLLLHKYNQLIVGKEPFDLIHAHYIGSAYLGARLKKYSGVPLIITEHSSKLNGELNGYSTKKLEFAYHCADQLTTVSQSLSNVIEEKFGIRGEVIPNIADTDIFGYMEEKPTPPPFIFATTGNLIHSKGMDLTITAFSKLLKLYPDSNLMIFGKGPEKERLMRITRQNGLTHHVTFMGLVSREDLNDYYNKCHCFVLASLSETFGVSYIEALAKGIPVIATDCGGPSEFIHAKNGILVPVNDVDALYDAMIYMIENSSCYSGQLISDEIKHKYSSRKNAESLEIIYRRVLEK